jgi:hypothetical protein
VLERINSTEYKEQNMNIEKDLKWLEDKGCKRSKEHGGAFTRHINLEYHLSVDILVQDNINLDFSW